MIALALGLAAYALPLLFVWCLCRAAGLADRSVERIARAGLLTIGDPPRGGES